MDWIDKEFEDAARRMFGMVEDSAIFLCLMPKEPDIKCCLELGAAIFYGKPILTVAQEGCKVPENLRKLSTKIVEDFDFDNPECQTRLGDAVKEMTG